jgi:hypothetical protein
MRALVILTLFAAFSCRAQDMSDISSKVFEKKDKEGKTAIRIETVYRGKTKVMMIMSRRNFQGALVVTCRGYLVGGDLVMTESDEDGDGMFETIAVYRTGEHDMEVFTRQHDGSVQPVSKKTLQSYKEQNAAISEFWDKAFQKDMNDGRIGKLLQDTQKKIQDTDRRKTDDKKWDLAWRRHTTGKTKRENKEGSELIIHSDRRFRQDPPWPDRFESSTAARAIISWAGATGGKRFSTLMGTGQSFCARWADLREDGLAGARILFDDHHFHLVVETPQPNLALGMKWVNGKSKKGSLIIDTNFGTQRVRWFWLRRRLRLTSITNANATISRSYWNDNLPKSDTGTYA